MRFPPTEKADDEKALFPNTPNKEKDIDPIRVM
jgi:hypothetical protein